MLLASAWGADTPGMSENTPREPLYDRVDRLVRDRRFLMLFIGSMVLALLRMTGRSVRLGSLWPIALGLVLAVAAVAGARVVAHKRAAAGMASRRVTAQWLDLPTPWSQLNHACESYTLLTGREPPLIAVKARQDVGERIDAELAFLGTIPNEHGNRPAVSPFGAPASAEPMCAFNEAMLDTYCAAELLAVLAHLMYRAEFARSETARLANGVCEADSKTLLLTREHAPLLRAIERVWRDRETPIPGTGSIHFSDADLRPERVSSAGLVTKWVTRDRVAELRTHLGAMGLDVPEGG